MSKVIVDFDASKLIVDASFRSTANTYKAVLVAKLSTGCIIYTADHRLLLTDSKYVELHVLSANMTNPVYDKLLKEANNK